LPSSDPVVARALLPRAARLQDIEADIEPLLLLRRRDVAVAVDVDVGGGGVAP
jgi:hypothetical protein